MILTGNEIKLQREAGNIISAIGMNPGWDQTATTCGCPPS